MSTVPFTSFIMQFTVNGTHPSSATALQDPLLWKLAFPPSQPDSEKWCRQQHRGSCRVWPYAALMTVLFFKVSSHSAVEGIRVKHLQTKTMRRKMFKDSISKKKKKERRQIQQLVTGHWRRKREGKKANENPLLSGQKNTAWLMSSNLKHLIVCLQYLDLKPETAHHDQAEGHSL